MLFPSTLDSESFHEVSREIKLFIAENLCGQERYLTRQYKFLSKGNNSNKISDHNMLAIYPSYLDIDLLCFEVLCSSQQLWSCGDDQFT